MVDVKVFWNEKIEAPDELQTSTWPSVCRARDWLLFDSADIRILPEDLKTVSLVKAWVIRVEFEDTTERLKEEIAGRSRVRIGPGDVDEIVKDDADTGAEKVPVTERLPSIVTVEEVQ